ncbi:MAG: FAD-binding oxidoreductase [Proteobacteria bacterium]|nr:FAD-binding oxidoreductase [Pseudomonadota bacterium]
MSRKDIVVLGAGMVGTSAALHLVQRGHSVLLLDREPPGRETSYGNAGIIQREAVEPYAFPRAWRSLLSAALQSGNDVRYHICALPALVPRLAAYWNNSSPKHYVQIANDYASLIAHSVTEHAHLIREAGASDLVAEEGYLAAYRTPEALSLAVKRAERIELEHGVRHQLLDTDALGRAEPGLIRPMAGAVHWLDPWRVRDPGELVNRYARLFERRGGQFLREGVVAAKPTANGWSVKTDSGEVQANHVVVALGPWASRLIQPLGYHLPLFVKRGYHRHYSEGSALSMPLFDAESGFVLAPTAQGMRLTTGVEFANFESPPTPVQLLKAESAARQIVKLSRPVESLPWYGWRPCTVDMKPVIGRAPKHKCLWFNFGHGHQGFTLGPASGRLLADLIDGQQPYLDPKPFAPDRF